MASLNLEQLLARSHKGIPPAPIILVKLLQLFAVEEKDSDEIVRTIRKDPALTMSLLQKSNSANYGSSVVADTIEEAVLRLGMNTIQRTVMALCAEKLICTPANTGRSENELWEHSLATGIAAAKIAEQIGADPGNAQIVGILHDIGKVIMFQGVRGYDLILQEAMSSHRSLVAIEDERLGTNHCLIGYELLNHWKVPRVFIEGVKDHHQPYGTISSVVFLADHIAYTIERGFGDSEQDAELIREVAGALGLDEEAIKNIALEVQEEIENEKSQLQLSAA